MHALRPTLAAIEVRLRDPSDTLLERYQRDLDSLSPEMRAAIESDDHEDTSGGHDAPLDHDLPPARMAHLFELHELLDRREASRRLQGVTDPAPGQIRLVEQIVGPRGTAEYDLPCPLAVVLSEPLPNAPEVWQGWMASPDPDYAAPWDLILEDTLADPLAAVVQCWNTVMVYLESTTIVIGQLSDERLAAVRALESDYFFGDDSAHLGLAEPGRRARRTVDGHDLLTGTPLGDEADDPRTRYQLLYHEAAEPLRVCAREALGFEVTSADEVATTARLADLARWINEAVASIIERLRERAVAAGVAFREVELVPTPASMTSEQAMRCVEVDGVLGIRVYGRRTEEFAVVHARLERLGPPIVTLEVLQDDVVVRHESLTDEQPTMDIALSGVGRTTVRILAPMQLDVPLPALGD